MDYICKFTFFAILTVAELEVALSPIRVSHFNRNNQASDPLTLMNYPPILMQSLSRSNEGSTEPTTVKNLRPFADMRNLVMVACHAVYTGSDYSKPLDFGSWFLLDYQKVYPALMGISLLPAHYV